MTIEEWRRRLAVLERAQRDARAACRGPLNPFAAPGINAAARAAEDAVARHHDQHPDYLSADEKGELYALLSRYRAAPTEALMIELMEWGTVWPEMTKWRADAEHPDHRAARLAKRLTT